MSSQEPFDVFDDENQEEFDSETYDEDEVD
jgi:hypothetical protein